MEKTRKRNQICTKINTVTVDFAVWKAKKKDQKMRDLFQKASIPKRIAIVIAGATVNIIFGLLVYFVLMSTSTTYVTNEISSVLDGYVAQEVGLQQNDKIVELDGKKIKNKYDLSKAMTKVTEPNDKNEKYNGEVISLKIERNGQTLEYQVKPTEIKTKNTGIYLDKNCKIISIEKDSSAEKKVGLKANDKITKINNQEINGDYNKIVNMIQEKGVNTILITVERKEQQITFEFTPDYISSYYLGVNLKQAENTLANHLIYGGIETKKNLQVLY